LYMLLAKHSLTNMADKLSPLGVKSSVDLLSLTDAVLGSLGFTSVQIRQLQQDVRTPNMQDAAEKEKNETNPTIESAEESYGKAKTIQAESSWWKKQLCRPKRIIFIRHGESEANVDREITSTVPDHCLHLTLKGREQALDAGTRLKDFLGMGSVKFIVSPYVRAVETFNGIKQAWGKTASLPWRTDPRIREQEHGNFDGPDIKKLHREKKVFGQFYYRFPSGESPADCYDRASSFLETLYRSFEDNTTENLVIVSHGLMIVVMLMRLFRISVEEWDQIEALKNCEFVVLERPDNDSRYSISFSWMGGEEKNYAGLRKRKDPPPPATIWDGNPNAALLSNEPVGKKAKLEHAEAIS